MFKILRYIRVANVRQHSQHRHRNQWLPHLLQKLRQLKLLAD
jgi:hypothetical protein